MRVQPRLVFFSGGTGGAEVPERVAGPLAATTGQDGTATIAYLRVRDRLVAWRVTADSIGEQDLPVTEETAKGAGGSIFVIKLEAARAGSPDGSSMRRVRESPTRRSKSGLEGGQGD